LAAEEEGVIARAEGALRAKADAEAAVKEATTSLARAQLSPDERTTVRSAAERAALRRENQRRENLLSFHDAMNRNLKQ
jgi:hypothetical protein